MQLSKKQKRNSEIFAPYPKSTSKFKNFAKKMTLIAYVFSKLQIAKDFVRQMSIKRLFRIPFDNQHVKGSQRFVTSSLWGKLTWKMSLLVIYENLQMMMINNS